MEENMSMSRRLRLVDGNDRGNSELFRKHCNLCNQSFRTSNKYVFFCKVCRSESELLKYSEWLSDSGNEASLESYLDPNDRRAA